MNKHRFIPQLEQLEDRRLMTGKVILDAIGQGFLIGNGGFIKHDGPLPELPGPFFNVQLVANGLKGNRIDANGDGLLDKTLDDLRFDPEVTRERGKRVTIDIALEPVGEGKARAIEGVGQDFTRGVTRQFLAHGNFQAVDVVALRASFDFVDVPDEPIKQVNVVLTIAPDPDDPNRAFDAEFRNGTKQMVLPAFLLPGDLPNLRTVRDQIITSEDTASLPINVLANDPDGNIARVVRVGDPDHGTATFTADGTVIYTPNPGYSGNDQFTYSVTDRSGRLQTELIDVIVNKDAVPSVSIGDVTVTEGDEGFVKAVFEVSLSAPSTREVTVDFTTAQGTAAAAEDYDPRGGQVVFQPRQTKQTITVDVKGDKLFEDSETFFVNLTTASKATIADGQGVATIVDDDNVATRVDEDPPTISITDVTVTEGDPTLAILEAKARFTVTLSKASKGLVSVNYATADGTAKAGEDYRFTRDTLFFDPGDTSASFEVQVFGDTLREFDETFFVNLTPNFNGTIADSQGMATIVDDEEVDPTISIDDVTVRERDSGTAKAVFTVSLSFASGRPINVAFSTLDDTATAPDDYDPIEEGTLTFNPGETRKTIPVSVRGDNVIEPDEQFLVSLNAATDAMILDHTGFGTIVNDDELTVSVDGAVVVEGNSGTRTDAIFTVSLSHASDEPITVSYLATNGSALSQEDFRGTRGSVTFAPGETVKTFPVQVFGDDRPEADELFEVAIFPKTERGKTGPVVRNGEALGKILNDDGQAPIDEGQGTGTTDEGRGTGTTVDDDKPPTVSVNDVTVREGNVADPTVAIFTLTLSKPSKKDVIVSYATASDTAIAGSDFALDIGTVLIPAGQTERLFPLTVFGDTELEPDETFFLNLTGATDATIGDGEGLGTITNDDVAVSIGDVQVTEGTADELTEGDDGSKPAFFPVTLSTPVDFPITVDFDKGNGTAIEGEDYSLTPFRRITFRPGQTLEYIPAFVEGDALAEEDETFSINLIKATNATIADAQGVATILDDDRGKPTVSISDATVTEGDSGTVPAVFQVSLSKPAKEPITVVALVNGKTAGPLTGYVDPGPVELVFPPDVVTQQLAVQVRGDKTDEPNQTFVVRLFSTGAIVADGEGLGTIIDDDDPPAGGTTPQGTSGGSAGESDSSSGQPGGTDSSGTAGGTTPQGTSGGVAEDRVDLIRTLMLLGIFGQEAQDDILRAMEAIDDLRRDMDETGNGPVGPGDPSPSGPAGGTGSATPPPQAGENGGGSPSANVDDGPSRASPLFGPPTPVREGASIRIPAPDAMPSNSPAKSGPASPGEPAFDKDGVPADPPPDLSAAAGEGNDGAPAGLGGVDAGETVATLPTDSRRLQDLQVTTEVRFVTVQESFLERIGIDFDIPLDDVRADLPRGSQTSLLGAPFTSPQALDLQGSGLRAIRNAAINAVFASLGRPSAASGGLPASTGVMSPALKRIPYVNRLFKNIGLGRENRSLLMMVTPRIIIQEEEE